MGTVPLIILQRYGQNSRLQFGQLGVEVGNRLNDERDWSSIRYMSVGIAVHWKYVHPMLPTESKSVNLVC